MMDAARRNNPEDRRRTELVTLNPSRSAEHGRERRKSRCFALFGQIRQWSCQRVHSEIDFMLLLSFDYIF
jgi:hypothetical protein